MTIVFLAITIEIIFIGQITGENFPFALQPWSYSNRMIIRSAIRNPILLGADSGRLL